MFFLHALFSVSLCFADFPPFLQHIGVYLWNRKRVDVFVFSFSWIHRHSILYHQINCFDRFHRLYRAIGASCTMPAKVLCRSQELWFEGQRWSVGFSRIDAVGLDCWGCAKIVWVRTYGKIPDPWLPWLPWLPWPSPVLLTTAKFALLTRVVIMFQVIVACVLPVWRKETLKVSYPQSVSYNI